MYVYDNRRIRNDHVSLHFSTRQDIGRISLKCTSYSENACYQSYWNVLSSDAGCTDIGKFAVHFKDLNIHCRVIKMSSTFYLWPVQRGPVLYESSNKYDSITRTPLSYSDLCIPTHCRCIGLLLHPTTLSGPHARTHTHSLSLSLSLSRRAIGQTQRPLPDNTEHSQEKDIHAPGGIRIWNPIKQAAANPGLWPLGHWYRLELSHH
jgi:hypothetical protein